MRNLILVILLLPFAAFAQQSNTYLKLTDASGQPIKGDVTTKGHEKSIAVLSFNSSGKNNSQLTFSMNITGASADLKRAMTNGSLLPNGILTVTQPGPGMPTIQYTIRMENIRVNNCAESMGCNGVMTTSAVITATRIGWTYYQPDAKGGQSTVSRKYGYDMDSGKEWTNF